tara:strand:+ start:296 stop:682 length:387 start_codon:yes stop_codon:yes gene_type:complete
MNKQAKIQKIKNANKKPVISAMEKKVKKLNHILGLQNESMSSTNLGVIIDLCKQSGKVSFSIAQLIELMADGGFNTSGKQIRRKFQQAGLSSNKNSAIMVGEDIITLSKVVGKNVIGVNDNKLINSIK